MVVACLGGNQGLFLLLGGGLRSLGGNGLLRGSGRELGSLGRSSRLGDGNWRGSRAGASTANHLLNLSGVIASILLAKSGDLVSLLLGDAAYLGRLGVDGVGSVLDVVVDELLVASVHQGDKEGNGGANDGEAPVGNELDEVVGHEGSDAGL